MFELEVLKDYEARGLIKGSSHGGFTVWCYTQKCVIERQWDEVTRSCRGLITGPLGELVARPFQKFHNYSEPEAVIEPGPFYAFDKMDGTLIVVGEYNGEAVVSTKGSFTTWHSEAARNLLMGFVPPKGKTVLFELIHPENRIVVDYGDYTGLVLLGVIDNDTGADDGLPEDGLDIGWHGDIVVRRNFNLKSMIETIKNPEAGVGREGFVVVWPHAGRPWNRVKLKFESYVKLHGIYTGLTNRRVWECMIDGTMPELMELAPDELHGVIREVESEIRKIAGEMVAEAVKIGSEAMLEPTRKDAAQLIMSKSERPITGLAFKVYDGKVDQIINDAIRLARPEVSQFVGNAGLS